jgi:hypothetical protein
MQSFRLVLTDEDRRFCQVCLGVAAGSLLLAGAAYAQDGGGGSSPIDQLTTETDKVTDVYDAITPAAVGSMIFGVGAMMVKRVAFA